MKDDDLIQALKRIKVQTGGLICLGCGHEHNCGVHGCAVIREAAQRLEELLKYKEAIDRMGKFGQLFVEYEGCPRGAMGRMCDATIQEEALAMDMLTDVDMGRWRPVNEDVLQELLRKAVIETGKEQNGELLTLDRLRELVKADREGRVKILAPAMLATCGSCTAFQRIPGTASGICEKREQFKVFQKRPCCKMYEAMEDCE